MGEGDCDTDSDCAGSLTCGNDNCRATGITGSNWDRRADCCEGKMKCLYIYFIKTEESRSKRVVKKYNIT